MSRNVQIVDVMFVEVPPTPDMYHRPFLANYDTDIGAMADEATHGGQKLDPGSLSTIAGAILRPAAQAEGKVGIANGFDSPRFIMSLILKIEEGNIMSRYEIVHGYTDEMGLSHMGSMNPRMKIFINNTTILSQMHPLHGQMATGDQVVVSHSTQILTPIQGWANEMQHPLVNPNAVTMRPTDVFNAISTQAGMAGAGGVGDIGFPGTGNASVIHDTRMGFGSRAKRSYRANNQNDVFLSKFLTGFREHAWSPVDHEEGGLQANQFENAARSVAEPLAIADAFLKLLTDRTGYSSEWSIEWADLTRFDPSLEQRRKVLPATAVHGPGAGDMASWATVCHETQVAQMILNIVPAMMASMAVGMMAFSITNRNLGGVPTAIISGMRGISPAIDVAAQAPAMEFRLAHEVLAQLTNMDSLILEVHAEISMVTDSRMTVSVNGGPATPFQAATYCDALFSPVYSANDMALGGIAQCLGILGGQLSNNAPRPPISLTSNLGTSTAQNPQVSQAPSLGIGNLETRF